MNLCDLVIDEHQGVERIEGFESSLVDFDDVVRHQLQIREASLTANRFSVDSRDVVVEDDEPDELNCGWNVDRLQVAVLNVELEHRWEGGEHLRDHEGRVAVSDLHYLHVSVRHVRQVRANKCHVGLLIGQCEVLKSASVFREDCPLEHARRFDILCTGGAEGNDKQNQSVFPGRYRKRRFNKKLHKTFTKLTTS